MADWPYRSSLGVAVIGAGVMGRRHADTFAQLDDIEVRVVADSDADRARTLAETLDAQWTTDVHEAVAEDGVQLVSVCTPDDLHVEAAVAAAEAGRHVIIEKPLATTISECRTIIDAFRDRDLLATVGHVCRFEPRHYAAHELVQEGSLGSLNTISTRRVQHKSAQDRLNGRCSLSLFLGVHEYDLVHWISGQEVARVTARATRGILSGEGYDVDDCNVALLELENGSLAAVELSWILPEAHATSYSDLDLFFSAGFARFPGDDESAVVSGPTSSTTGDMTFTPRFYDGLAGALAQELRLFVRSVRAQSSPVVSLEDATRAVAIAVAVDESISTGSPVTVKKRPWEDQL